MDHDEMWRRIYACTKCHGPACWIQKDVEGRGKVDFLCVTLDGVQSIVFEAPETAEERAAIVEKIEAYFG